MTTVVIPTRNEPDLCSFTRQVAETARTLPGGCDLIVSDWSDEPPCNCYAKVIRLSGPGLWFAYRAAWDQIPADEYVVHLDAGGSHDPGVIHDLLQIATGRRADLVVGSRFLGSGSHRGRWHRRQTSRLASFAMRLATGCNNTDWTSGFRVFSPSLRAYLRDFPFTTEGHAWQIESLYETLAEGFTVEEHPIDYYPSTSSLNRARVVEAARLWRRYMWR